MNKLFKGLAYACLFNTVVLFTWAIKSGNNLIFVAACIMLCLALCFYYETAISILREERDIYRKHFLIEAQKNSMIVYRRETQKVEDGTSYAEEIAPIALN